MTGSRQLVLALAAAGTIGWAVSASPAAAEDGFYLGILGGVYVEDGDAGPIISKLVGFNVVTGDLVFGAEAEALGPSWVDGDFYANLMARARFGIVLGEDGLLYGAAGFSGWTPDFDLYPTIGGGAELGFSETMSGRFDLQAILYGASEVGYLVRGGIVIHP